MADAEQTQEQHEADIRRAVALARAIIDEVPREAIGRLKISARLLALMILVEPRGRSVQEIGDLLGIAQASTSALVDEGARLGVVARTRLRGFPCVHVVDLTPKGHRLRRARRGSGA